MYIDQIRLFVNYKLGIIRYNIYVIYIYIYIYINSCIISFIFYNRKNKNKQAPIELVYNII